MKYSSGFIGGMAMTVLLFGCASTPQRPSWIDNPSPGVSGSATMNVNGRFAQEEMAISRARTEFARRLGVDITSGQIINTTFSNNQESTHGNSVSKELLDQKGVMAEVKAKWYDENADVVYVWLVPTK
jgi:hypothetical protein